MFQVNVCRALAAIELAEQHPGLTAWELSQKTGTAYAEISMGLNKARTHQWVDGEPEDREQGGIRYRYYPLADKAVIAEARAEHAAAVQRIAATFQTRA